MSLFDGFFSRLMSPVGDNRENKEDDVATVRSGLSNLNYRTDEDKGENIFTRGLHNAIKLFQRDENLKEDGWLAPGGPTEQRLETRVAQNNRTQSDAEEDRILSKASDDEAMGHVEGSEYRKKKLYLDTLGNPTIGVGFMIPNVAAAITYPFYKQNETPRRRATDTEVETNFYKVQKMPFGQNLNAEKFMDATDIELDEADITPRFQQKLRSEAEALRQKFPRFDDAPKDVQLGLLDMQYNIGNAKFQREFIDPKTGQKKGWPGLFDAYDKKDWRGMAVQSHRIGIGDDRNKATYQLFKEAE